MTALQPPGDDSPGYYIYSCIACPVDEKSPGMCDVCGRSLVPKWITASVSDLSDEAVDRLVADLKNVGGEPVEFQEIQEANEGPETSEATEASRG